ncbi:class F sortase [Streptomyces flavofungini]|uniref:Class F sortase n=1 Tax=Streptomyces flavofungini TaxID=68200 RepID=A0ABS0XAY0_9ACTN|nr:class F sortase [Streptomyces flavofungini]MBJ3810356.1 class F sortase [Streptomyces flavofungini]MBJ3811980.1 class F sortase [Streptomyces flavofungini]GHC51169.1 class F sortase [Streptomyces flavofungini]
MPEPTSGTVVGALRSRGLVAGAVLSFLLATGLLLAPGPSGGGPPADFGQDLEPGTAAPRGTPETTAAEAPGEPSAGSPQAAGEPVRPADGAGRATRSETEAAPLRVRLPRLHLSARLRAIGVDVQGRTEIPADPDEAGWYRYGPAPGAPNGSAVLVGHVDSRTGELGAFAALYDIRADDTVMVEREAAEPLRYRVTARRTVPKQDLPLSVFRRDGRPVLTLITCAAPFDPARGGYRRNLVITAVPTSS